MVKTSAERQSAHRKRRRDAMAVLQAENAALRAELDRLKLKESHGVKESHGAELARRLDALEEQADRTVRRLDQLEAMANQGY